MLGKFEGFISFDTAHQYADSAESALAWASEHFDDGWHLAKPGAWVRMKSQTAVFPVLSTSRLLLREMRQDDCPGYGALLTDEREAYLITDTRVSAEEVPARIEHNVRAFEQRRAVYWSVTRNNGDFAGFVALHALVSPTPALSYAISRSCRRQGIATEALAAVIDYVVGELDARCLLARTHVENLPSAQLLLALGFRDDGVAESANGPRRQFHFDALEGRS